MSGTGAPDLDHELAETKDGQHQRVYGAGEGERDPTLPQSQSVKQQDPPNAPASRSSTGRRIAVSQDAIKIKRIKFWFLLFWVVVCVAVRLLITRKGKNKVRYNTRDSQNPTLAARNFRPTVRSTNPCGEEGEEESGSEKAESPVKSSKCD